MQILGQEIPRPPADCRYGRDCAIDVQTVKILVDYILPAPPADTPSDPPRTDDSDPAVSSAYTAELTDTIADAMARHQPVAARCAKCVIDCALGVLRGDVVQV